MGYPNWARSTVTGRLYRVYYTHGDYGRANALKRRVIRQTRNLIRMGLLRSVRGLSGGLSGSLFAIVVGKVTSASGQGGRGLHTQCRTLYLCIMAHCTSGPMGRRRVCLLWAVSSLMPFFHTNPAYPHD